MVYMRPVLAGESVGKGRGRGTMCVARGPVVRAALGRGEGRALRETPEGKWSGLERCRAAVPQGVEPGSPVLRENMRVRKDVYLWGAWVA